MPAALRPIRSRDASTVPSAPRRVRRALTRSPRGGRDDSAAARALAARDGHAARLDGVAFNAVEAATSIAFGAAAVLQLATRLPRWAVATAGACGVAAVAGAFSMTVLVQLV